MTDEQFDTSARWRNDQAERALLGALLIDGAALDRVADQVRSDDFANPRLGLLYRAMLDLGGRGVAVDYSTLLSELERTDQLARVGGAADVTALINAAPTAFNAPDYARQVAQAARLRRLLGAADAIRSTVEQHRGDAAEAIGEAERILRQVDAGRSPARVVTLRDALERYVAGLEARQQDRPEDIQGQPVATGFVDLDRALAGGLRPGILSLLAARPRMGKTAWLLNATRHAAGRGVATVLYSLEMSVDACVERLLVAEARVDAQRLRQGYVDEHEWRRIGDAYSVLAGLPVWLDDTPALTLTELTSRARRLRADHGVGLVGIDYVQLVRVPSAQKRVEAVSEVSQGLKALARELEVPVLALAQLSRAVEGRPDHRPLLSDLGESGQLERDADVVLFLHREEVYRPQTDRRGIADLILAKQRSGPEATIPLRWHASQTRFADLEMYRQEEP